MKSAGLISSRIFRLLMLCGLLLVIGLNAAFAKSGAKRYEIAIVPFLPYRATLQNYEPMRVYLEEKLKAPVSLVTAANYQAFNERLQQQAYPFVITVATSSYLAWHEYGYKPMLRPQILTRPALVMQKARALPSVQGLRGAKIATTDPQGIIAMQAQQMLRELGLNPETDVQLQFQSNHAAAVNFVISGEVDAAIVSDRALQQMPVETRDAVRVETVWDKGAAPGVVYLASPRVPVEQTSALMKGIQDFLKTEAGLSLMQRLGYGTLVPATVEDLKPLAPYGEQLKRLVEQNKP